MKTQTPSPFLAADILPSLTPEQKVLAWDAAVKVASTGQTLDQAAIDRNRQVPDGPDIGDVGGERRHDRSHDHRAPRHARPPLRSRDGLMTMTAEKAKHHTGNGRPQTLVGYPGFLNRSVRLQLDLHQRLILAAERSNVTPSSLIRAILSANLPDLPDGDR